MKVAILGAGIAGLTLAHALRRDASRAGRPLDLALFEAQSRAGGRIRTTEDGGFRIEWAADGFQTGSGPALTLLRDLGLENERVPASKDAARRYVFARGGLHRFPMDPMSLLRFGAISLPGRLRVMAEPFLASRVAREETVLDFASRHIGAEAAKVMMGAFVRGVYAGDAARLSADAAFPKVRELERKHRSMVLAMMKERQEGGRRDRLWSLRRGMGSLTDRLAETLGSSIHFSMPALRLSRLPEYAAPTPFTLRFANGESRTFDAVIVATPPHDAAALLRDLDLEAANALRDIVSAGVAVVALAFRHEAFRRKPDGYGFLVAPGEPLPILGALNESNLFPDRAPEGFTLVRAFLGGVDRPELMTEPDAKLAALACEALDRAVGLKGGPARTWVLRQPNAIPQYTLGHRERVAAVMKRIGAFPGLYVAGNAYRGVSVGSILEDADRVAGWLLHAAR